MKISLQGGAIMTFLNSLEITVRRLHHLIRHSKSLLEKDIKIDTTFLNEIDELITEYDKNESELILYLNKLLDENIEKIDEFFKKYSDNIYKYKSVFADNRNTIAKKNQLSINQIIQKSEDYKLLMNEDYENIKRENNTILASYEQKMQIISLDRKNAINRLKYLVSFPILNYNMFIEKTNDHLEKENQQIHSVLSRKMFNFDEALKLKNEKLNSEIKEKNQITESYQKDLDVLITKVKEIISENNVKLNKKINDLSSKRNDRLFQLKQEFDDNMKMIENKHSAIKNDYINKSREALKTFTTKLNQIDIENERLFKRYNRERTNLISKFREQTLDFQIRFRKMFKSNSEKIGEMLPDSNNSVLYKQITNDFKQNRVEMNKEGKIMEKNQKIAIKKLEKNYLNLFEALKEQKVIAENEKNLALASYDILEEIDHTEINNLETSIKRKCDYDVLLVNKNLTIAVNELRLTSEISNELSHENIAILLSDYSNKIAKINHEKSILVSELNNNQKHEKLIHSKNDFFLKGTQSLNNILTLLKIEKSKKLKSFNVSTYDNLIAKENYDYDHKKEKINEERNHLILINSIKTRKVDATIENNRELSNIELQHRNDLDEHFLKKEKLLYVKKLGDEKYKLYSLRFECELVMYNNVLQTYLKLIKNFSYLCDSIFDKISDVTVKMKISSDFQKDFLNNLFVISNKHFITISNEFLDAENKIIESRIKFETGFKYDALFNEINDNHTSTVEKFTIKQKELRTKLNSVNVEIEDLSKKIFNYMNDSELLKKEIVINRKNKKYRNIATLKKRLFTIKKQILFYEKETKIKSSLETRTYKHLTRIPFQISFANRKRDRESIRLQQQQRNEAYVYYHSIDLLDAKIIKYRDDLNDNYRNLISQCHNDIEKVDKNYNKYKMLRNHDLLNFSHTFKYSFEQQVSLMKIEHKKMYDRYLFIYAQGIRNTDKHYRIVNFQTEKKIENINRQYEKNQMILDENIENQYNLYHQIIKGTNSRYLSNLNKIDFVKFKNHQKFYTEVESITANMNYLVAKNKKENEIYNIEHDNSLLELKDDLDFNRKNANESYQNHYKANLLEIDSTKLQIKYRIKGLREEAKYEIDEINYQLNEAKENLKISEKYATIDFLNLKNDYNRRVNELASISKNEIKAIEKSHYSKVKSNLKQIVKETISEVRLINEI